MTAIIRTRTHEIAGAHLSIIDKAAFEVVFKELPCDCGADRGRYHTCHEGNPTGHSVDCPVFLRWAAADSAIAFAEALQAISMHASDIQAGREIAERALAENTGWLIQ